MQQEQREAGTQCRMPAFVRSRPRATCSKGRRFGGEPGRLSSCSATGSSPARPHSPAGTAHTAQLQGDNWRMRRAGQSTLSGVKVGECLEIKVVLGSARPPAPPCTVTSCPGRGKIRPSSEGFLPAASGEAHSGSRRR